MKRRDFIKKSAGAGIIASSAYSIGHASNFFTSGIKSMEAPIDLVAVKGGEAAQMFDKAIAALGGMSKFVQKNKTVVVKPNIGWNSPPERGANTNPQLVARIIEHCLNAGAKTVYMFDNPVNEWTRSYKNSGIEAAAKNAGAKVVTGSSESHYHQVDIKNGKVLKKVKVHELILESDVFINVPTLKSHSGSKLSISMKNLMGVIWDRRFWHGNGLHQCIADFATSCKPTLNVVDAYRVLKRNGPQGVSVNDVLTMKYQMISTNMVTADAAATKLFGFEPKELKHLVMAEQQGVGSSNLQKINIKRISL